MHTVFLHHSATDNPEHDDVEWIRNIHVYQNGWNDIGYSYYINKKGEVFNGRHLEVIPAAQKGFNTGSIAICCGGLNDFPRDQMKALKELCLDINSAFDGNIVFKAHKDVNATDCPHYDYKSNLCLDEEGYMIYG